MAEDELQEFTPESDWMVFDEAQEVTPHVLTEEELQAEALRAEQLREDLAAINTDHENGGAQILDRDEIMTAYGDFIRRYASITVEEVQHFAVRAFHDRMPGDNSSSAIRVEPENIAVPADIVMFDRAALVQYLSVRHNINPATVERTLSETFPTGVEDVRLGDFPEPLPGTMPLPGNRVMIFGAPEREL